MTSGWDVPPSGGAVDGPPAMPAGGLDVAQAGRYEAGGLLGAGGMGEVRVVRDTHLGRDVALKRVLPGTAPSELLREARLTARLQHPGIMPILDVGLDPQGALFYTMPVLAGRSLDRVLDDPDVDHGRCVRHVLDAARAVAHAHRQGILHRDIKPANLVIGALGETVVADWGLAATLEEAGRARGVVGTPGYLAPEAAAGGPVDARVDVWGLGACLFEVLTWQAPGVAPRPVRDVAPDTSPALATIVDRALAADPHARYADAGAFAADLDAWLDGRRVAAHHYTTWELLALLWRQQRAALVVGGASVLALGAVLVVGLIWTAAERDRAQVAERIARAAEEDARTNLAAALVAQAKIAASVDDRAAAEVLATEALTIVESAEARGVLSRFAGRPRLRRVGVREVPGGCRRLSVSPSGRRLVCSIGTEVVLFDVTGPPRELHRLDVLPRHLVLLDDDTVLLSVDGQAVQQWRPPQRPVPISGDSQSHGVFGPPAGGRVLLTTNGLTAVVADEGAGRWTREVYACPIGEFPTSAVMEDDGEITVGCHDGGVYAWRAGERRLLRRFTEAEGVPATVAASGGRVAVSTARGRLFVLDRGTGAVVRELSGETGQVRTIAVQDDLVAVRTEQGYLRIWHADDARLVGQIRRPSGDVRWVAPDEVELLGPDQWERWRVPPVTRPHRLPAPSGLASVAYDPTGRLIAAGGGGGWVTVWSADAGEELRALQWQPAVIKQVAFSPDGLRLATGFAAPGDQRVFDTHDWSFVGLNTPAGARRLAWPSRGPLLLLLYLPLVHQWDGVTSDWLDLTRTMEDLAVWGDVVASVDGSYGLYRWSGREPVPVGTSPGALCITPLADGYVVGAASDLVFLDGAGAEVGRQGLSAVALDLATSPDGALVAVGLNDGAAEVWRVADRVRLARMEGHAARVSSVAFSADGQWLATASFDGDVRQWEVGSLTRSPSPLRDEVQAAWTFGVREALGATSR